MALGGQEKAPAAAAMDQRGSGTTGTTPGRRRVALQAGGLKNGVGSPGDTGRDSQQAGGEWTQNAV